MRGSAYFALDNYSEAARTISPLGDPAIHDTSLGYAWAASLSRLGDLTLATQVLQEYVDHVEISWPSGAVETLNGLGVNQFYSVLEVRELCRATAFGPLP